MNTRPVSGGFHTVDDGIIPKTGRIFMKIFKGYFFYVVREPLVSSGHVQLSTYCCSQSDVVPAHQGRGCALYETRSHLILHEGHQHSNCQIHQRLYSTCQLCSGIPILDQGSRKIHVKSLNWKITVCGTVFKEVGIFTLPDTDTDPSPISDWLKK